MVVKRGKPKIISAAGRWGTRQVAVLRLASLLSAAITIICIGKLLNTYVASNKYVFIALLAAIIGGICAFLEVLSGVWAARREEIRLRRALLESLYASPQMAIREAGAYEPAQVVTLLNDHVERTTEFRQNYWGSTQAALLAPFLISFYIFFAIDKLLGGLFFIALPAVPLLAGGFMRLYRKRSRLSRARRAQLAGKYLDAIRNLVPIRLLGAGERVETDLRQVGEANRRSIMRMLAGNQVVIIILDGAVSLLLITMSIAVSLLRLQAGIITVGEAITVVLLLMIILEPIEQVAGFFYVGMGGLAAQKALRRYLAAHPRPAQNLTTAGDSARVPSISAVLAIKAQHISYAYGENTVLKDLNLEVLTGSTVAIIGDSGCGKSTFISLLSGQIPMQGGELEIGGVSATSNNVALIRAASATVMQRSWLFSGTIAENLYFANPQATEAELWQALEAANIAADIRRMPRQLHTDVGEGGDLLSGGQKQRISLARALLSGREILLFDEASAHVDYESEALITKAIASLATRKTIVLVTHRHSLLKIADVVYRLEDGVLKKIDTTGMEYTEMASGEE